MKRLLLIVGIFVGLCFCAHNTFADNGLPTLNLTLNGTDYATISAGEKDDKYSGNQLSITVDGNTTDYADVELKGRGNSTWSAPKKPFQIKFKDKTDLFDMGKSKKWVLLADYYDDSHLRNKLAFYYDNLLDTPYANHGVHVDLYIDGQYMGVYLLCHKTELGKNTINLKNDLGVLVEMDNIHEPDEDYWFTTDYGKHQMLIKETVADTDEASEAALKDFRSAFNRFEAALYANDYEAAKAEIDLESFAKYFLMLEYSVDVDGLASSIYFYKDGPDDVIHIGPAWDYDFAFSNYRWNTHGNHLTPYRSWAQTIFRYGDITSINDTEIFARLMDHPEFRNLVKQLFQNHILPNIDNIDAFILESAQDIRASAHRDNTLWGRDNFDENTFYLREWSKARLEYMNILYGINNAIVSGSYRIRSYNPKLNEMIFNDDYYLQPQNDGSYKIIAINSGRALAADHANEEGTTVSFMRPLNIDAQRWYITHAKDNQNYIISKTSGLFLTIENDKLTIREYKYNDSQIFNLFYRMKAIVKTNGSSFYRLSPSNNHNLSYNGQQLVANNSFLAKDYIVTKNFDSSYNLVDPITGQSENWIIQEASDSSLKLIEPHRLQALSHRQTEISFSEIANAKEQGWNLIENRLPQLSNPLIIVKP